MTADGKFISSGCFGPKNVSDLNENDPIEKQIINDFNAVSLNYGSVYWEIDNNKNVTVVQWSELAAEYSDTPCIVGQYPDPETSAENFHKIGTKF